LTDQGYDQEIAQRIANPVRTSTLKLYRGKWNKFLQWAKLKDTEIDKITVPMIAQFLNYLFNDLGLEVSTIEGYKTSIAKFMNGISSLEIGTNDHLKNLIKSFYRDRPRNLRVLPHWDLSVVLHALSKAPYEPMHEASLKWLTYKTIFLVALASGKRRSEIHALLYDKVKYSKSQDTYCLGVCPSFVAKNQVTRKLNESLKDIQIIGLKHKLGPDMKEEKSLCPVRALNYYFDRTKTIRDSGQKRLFISTQRNSKKDICANTISGWIKAVIRHAYDQKYSENELKNLNMTAHSVRSVAVSWAATGGASLDQILNACQWQSENSFTTFYLKDVDWKHPDKDKIPHFVAAQTVVNPNKIC